MMKTIQLLQYSFNGRRTSVLFMMIAMILAAALLFTVNTSSTSLREGIKQHSGVYEMIVGAEGSGMQLTLSSLLRVETPLGNIPYSVVEQLQKDARVLKAVPIGLGDSYYGYPIVGTTADYFTPFRPALPERFRLVSGAWFAKPGDTVIGYEVAKKLNLKVGDTFFGSHGLNDSGEEHHELSYVVTGILEPTGLADDRSLFTPLETIWAVHEHMEEPGSKSAESGDDHDQAATAIMLKVKQLGFAPGLKQELDRMDGVQAVFPLLYFRQLYDVFQMGERVAMILSGVAVLLALLAVVFALWGGLAQRRKEFTVLRALGMPRQRLIGSLLMEILMLAACSTLFGFLLSRLAFWGIQQYGRWEWAVSLPSVPSEPILVLYCFAILLIVLSLCFSPLLLGFRRSVHQSLQDMN
ncbi:ABC transporter permease [Paenibacillus chartarius]|uniref:Putative hemin transport system permease protein HrtB n=1 Tax=Paenibacillus chartarius TaxID=747481 RepID=A0ABV6DLA2_9BACL